MHRRIGLLVVLIPACGSSPPCAPPAATAVKIAPDAAPQVAKAGDDPVLTPRVIGVDFLAINSLRGEFVGHDDQADVCVRLIWDFSNHNKDVAKHCDDFFEGFPYVAIEPGACEPATRYWGDAAFVSGAGCVDLKMGEGTSTVDVAIQVKGKAFTGTIKMKSP